MIVCGIAFVVFAFLCIITMPAVLFYGGVKASNAVGEANSLLATAAQAAMTRTIITMISPVLDFFAVWAAGAGVEAGAAAGVDAGAAAG